MSSEGHGRVGFVGLGNMGRPIAVNVAKTHDTVVHDAAGTEARAPDGAQVVNSNGEIAGLADTVMLSLPNGDIVARVAEEMIETNNRRVSTLIDTSTIGPEAARRIQQRCADAKIDYADAPVSGGTAGAAAGTIAVMFSGPEDTFQRVKPVLDAMSTAVFHVGAEPGMGQAMKLLNNFVSATSMAATSEAIAYGEGIGLDMGVMIDVLNASSGRTTASEDKFPNRIRNGKFDAGFTNVLMEKDVGLFLESASAAGDNVEVAQAVVALWRRFLAAAPGDDLTKVYPFVKARN